MIGLNKKAILIICVIILGSFIILYKKLQYDKFNNEIIRILKPYQEPFIVADAQDFTSYQKFKKDTEDSYFDGQKLDLAIKTEQDYSDQTVPYSMDSHNLLKSVIINGESVDVSTVTDTIDKTGINYDQDANLKKTQVTGDAFGYNPPSPVVSCANSSIDAKFKNGLKNPLPYSIACGEPNYLTAENYYKTFSRIPVYLEDYAVRGANYMDFTDYIHPTKLNTRILSQNTKGLPERETLFQNIPSGSNYAFPASPAMRV